MTDKCLVCLLGLIILRSVLTGTSGVKDTRVFCNSGENCHVPCNNALSDCTSSTWLYNRHSATVELIAKGKTKNDIERRERLSLGSNCSLNIKKVTKEDHGYYSCRQYVNGQQKGPDARVYLHVLQVSSSSSQTELRPGSSVTLSCLLNSHQIPCDTLVQTEDIRLIWVNLAGVDLQTDPRYQVSFSSEKCISTLKTTLLNEDHNREWRCQVTQRKEVKASATYTVKYSDHSTTNPSESHTQVIVISAVPAALAVVLVVVLWVICKNRTDNKRRTDSYVVKEKNEHNGTYETINMSIPMPNINDQTDDVTYSEVTALSKKQVQVDNDHSNDTVTYAAIRGT
ncbi:uncharacterized protein LOC113060013 [Carassius auratus]|uniref:Uncharacterized protein LOC113060013 n=1 Tax=Carassius auratus TaxID=7957 RepID=A0A6P6LLS0_CARAU|nr:uncharacterized protein LOC113060013 [Carassius auratus]